jgi:hypothetical protein
LNAQCKAVLSKAGRGDQVTISSKTKLVGAGSYLLPRTAQLFLKYNNKQVVLGLLQYLIIIL